MFIEDVVDVTTRKCRSKGLPQEFGMGWVGGVKSFAWGVLKGAFTEFKGKSPQQGQDSLKNPKKNCHLTEQTFELV